MSRSAQHSTAQRCTRLVHVILVAMVCCMRSSGGQRALFCARAGTHALACKHQARLPNGTALPPGAQVQQRAGPSSAKRTFPKLLSECDRLNAAI